MHSRTLAALLLLICCTSSALAATKVWYGNGYRRGTGEYVKPFFTTADDPKTGGNGLIAVGITWTQTFISGMETSPLPLTSQLIPVANGNFNYTGLTVPLTFNSQLPTGPNPNNTDIPLGIPFPFVRITYSPSGFPTNGNTPSFVGVYTTPMWAISFHMGEFNDWNSFWNPQPTGNCMGLSKQAFNLTMLPVAARCFPTGRFANTGTILPGSAATIIDLGGPEWAVPPGTLLRDSALQYGQFNGSLAYLQTMITHAHLTNQTSELNCKSIQYYPRNLPVARLFPTQFCLRNVGATIVLELRRFVNITAGDCTISDTNQATVNSFFPSGFNPPYLSQSCLNNSTGKKRAF